VGKHKRSVFYIGVREFQEQFSDLVNCI